MKILLVNPSHIGIHLPFFPKIVLEKNGRFLPLGLLYIVSYIKQHLGHISIKIFDAQIYKNYLLEYKKTLKEFKPDIIGISAFTLTFFRTVELAKIAKEMMQDVHINIGGPHTTIYPDETIRLPWIDSVTIGEGEVTFKELIERLLQKGSLEGINGIIFKYNNKIIKNPQRECIREIDSLPFPDRNILTKEPYFFIVNKNIQATTMITSRGCPYNCIFCDNRRKLYIQRSPGNIVDEMEYCLNLGYKHIDIYDDVFTINKKNTIEVCKEIINRNLKLTWTCRGRVNNIDEEMAEWLNYAGCERINLGLEAGTDRVLKIMNKSITVKQSEKVVKILKKFDIKIIAYFIIGAPYETKEEIEQTIKFATRLDLDYVQFTIMVPFPGTPLYNMAIEEIGDYYKNYLQAPFYPTPLRLWKTTLSDQELLKLLRLAYRKFYFRLSYIYKMYKENHDFNGIVRKISGAFQLLKFILNI